MLDTPEYKASKRARNIRLNELKEALKLEQVEITRLLTLLNI